MGILFINSKLFLKWFSLDSGFWISSSADSYKESFGLIILIVLNLNDDFHCNIIPKAIECTN